MEKAKVKWWDDAKGYGFLTLDSNGRDVFVHYSKIEGKDFKSLIEGFEVEVEYEQGPKGLAATNVVKLE